MPDTPGSPNYPLALDSAISLFEVRNDAGTQTTAPVFPDDTTITVLSTEGFPPSGAVKLDDEIVFYTALAPTAVGTVAAPVLRGRAGTEAAAHGVAVPVELVILAQHHEVLRDTIIELEGKVGVGASQPPPDAVPDAGSFLQGLGGGQTGYAPLLLSHILAALSLPSLAGQAGKTLVVNDTEDGFIFATPAPPTHGFDFSTSRNSGQFAVVF